ncbi:MAG: tRNA-dihydrouridine synthase family protein [archaeon]|nr:tRNA-dihydrouridine synthase family protein [archaeon]
MELHLASMENVTCWAFRKLCHGVTDSYTGMLSMNYLIRRSKAWKEVDTFPIPNQRQWIQVATSKEKECSEFIARLQRELKEDSANNSLYGIQLNASCPSPNIVRLGQGPALIKRCAKVSSLIKELLKQDKYKVSLKVRLGMNAEEVKQRKLFALLEELEKISDSNFTNVAVHFKHAREQSFTPYNYDLLKEILSFKIPIVINGGIKNYKDFNNITKSLTNKKNLVGFMIGREALKNPDCFIEPNKILNNHSLPFRSQAQIKLEFLSLCKEHEPKSIYLDKIKEYCPWYN